MQTEADRYNIVQQASRLSKKEFAESLGISKAMGYQISTGLLKPSREVMDAIRHNYNVNLHWFLTGTGSYGNDPQTVEIELLDQEASAGQGRDVEDYIEKQYIPILYSLLRPHNPKNLKAVYVKGDSMVDERINDGDIAIYNIKQTEGNGIYVVSVGSTLMIKRIDFDPAKQEIKLISANPAYETRFYSGNEMNEIKFEGRVIACYHRV